MTCEQMANREIELLIKIVERLDILLSLIGGNDIVPEGEI